MDGSSIATEDCHSAAQINARLEYLEETRQWFYEHGDVAGAIDCELDIGFLVRRLNTLSEDVVI